MLFRQHVAYTFPYMFNFIVGALAVVSKDGYMVMAVLLVVFLLALVLIALLLAGKLAAKKKVPVYVDDDPRDNIMPYHDEGKLHLNFNAIDLIG